MELFKKYYRIGISGHRDLLASQKDENLKILKGYLLKIKREHLDSNLLIVTPLSDGADRLVIFAARELNIEYEVILPMPKKLYIKDFSEESLIEFNELVTNAKSERTIGMYAANTVELISDYSPYRDFQYRQVGREVVNCSNEMIIMSDGLKNNKMGGTEDISSFAEKQKKKRYIISCRRSA
jgi:hypothetical protein